MNKLRIGIVCAFLGMGLGLGQVALAGKPGVGCSRVCCTTVYDGPCEGGTGHCVICDCTACGN